MEDEMIRDREQPLNPPGIDAPDRKVKRQYIPMREYDDIEANGYEFYCMAEVENTGIENTSVSKCTDIFYWVGDDYRIVMPNKFIDSAYFPSDPRIPGPTWRELIEREICRQAALLPCTAWEVEYEGD
jgi:hypothetical protein